MGEGVLAPMRCIRRGRYKFVYIHGQPPLLFDLQADPLEQHNLAGCADLAAIEASLRQAVLQGFDPQAVHAAVLRSQEDRLMMVDALFRGEVYPWAWPGKTPGVVK